MGRASFIDKQQKLNTTTSPKIIVIGGSNANYGLNSKLLQDSLGMPVVNMSLNANVSLLFFCNAIKKNVNKGDIVLLLPEYQFFNPDEDIYGNQNLYQLATITPNVIRYFTPMQWCRSFMYLDDICAANIESISYMLRKQPTETRRFYNKWGDFIGHKNKTTTLNKSPQVYVNYSADQQNFKDINEVTKEELLSFHQFITEKQATLLVDWPVYAKPLMDEHFPKLIKNELHDLNWIGNYADYVYEESFLYDSPYHLKYQYQMDRTLKVIKDIKVWRNRL